MAVIDELLVSLGFKYDPDDMQQFKNDIVKTTDTIKKLARAAAVAATAVTGLTFTSTKASDEQGKLANEIGDTVENIDALQFAIQRAGGSAEGMTSSLRQLAVRAAEAARGVGTGVEAFGLLGLSTVDAQGNLKTASQLLLEVSNRFQGLDQTRQIELADKLGIRESIRLLQQGPDAIQGLIQEAQALGVTTAEDAAIAAEFQDSLTDLWRVIKQVSRTLSREFAPVLKTIADRVTDWWKENRQIIEQKLPEWIEKTTKVFTALAIALSLFFTSSLIVKFLSLIGVIKNLTIATLAANAAAALFPALIGASIAALLLLIQDAKVFFEGGSSFIGDMVNKFPQWANEIILIADLFNNILVVTKQIFEGWNNIIDLFRNYSVAGFSEFINNIPGFVADITGVYRTDGSGLVADITESLVQIKNNIKTNIGNAITNTFDRIRDLSENIKTNIGNAITNTFDRIRDLSENIKANIGNAMQPIIGVFNQALNIVNLIQQGWANIIDLLQNFTFDGFRDFIGNLPGFLGDITGLSTVEGTGVIPELGQAISNTSSTIVDKIDIVIQGGADTAENIADAVLNVFQQTAQDLNSAVDQ